MTARERAPGQQVGRYELVRLLGRGGMGEVWETVLHGPRGFRKPVALKLLLATPDPDDERALVQEARLGAMLQHPNVVATYELGRADETWYVAMELVRGASVRESLRAAPLGTAAVVEIGVHAAAGLAHVHTLTVHRDIKPANLLLDRSGLVKIADLGIAWTTGSTSVAGTPSFMAPEQAEGHPEPRSDLFSLGATLLALETRRLPFGSGARALAAVRQVDQLLTTGLLDGVDAALAAVLERCLRHDPRQRFESAAQLGAALAALRPGLGAPRAVADLLGGDGPAPAGFPTPNGTDVPTVVLSRDNLPRAADRFVGRDELQDLVVTLGRERLVTLQALGGMGKTRLAIEAARALAPDLPGGAWFVDLAEARTTEGLCFAVAGALSVELGRGDPVEQLGHALRSRGRALFVLDNLEQGVAAFAPAVARWLELAPRATFLGTSRVPLGLRAERRVVLGPLPEAQAVRLFVERAAVAIADEDRPAIAEVCRLVEGMPLAIELAAARTGLLSIHGLRRRLDDRLRILAAGGRHLPERHRSLTAALEGSWELLSPWAQAALAQLSVFEGGFRLEAAEAVLDLGAWPEAGWALDLLTELAGASLVQVDAERGRFSTRVVVHQFASRFLEGPERAAAEARHGAHYAQLGDAEALAALDGPAAVERREASTAELDNLVAACRRAVLRGDGAVAAATALAASRVLDWRGPLSAAPPLLEAAWDLAPTDRRPALAAAMGTIARHLGESDQVLARLRSQAHDPRVLVALGALHMDAGRIDDARHALDTALEGARRAGDRVTEALALSNLAILASRTGRRDESGPLFHRALVLYRAIGHRDGEGTVLGSLAGELVEAGRLDEAREHYERALAARRAMGDRRGEGVLLGSCGNLLLYAGDLPAARRCHLAALELHRRVGNRAGEGVGLTYLGLLHASADEPDAARQRLLEAREALTDAGDRRFLGLVDAKLASLEYDAGRTDEALSLLREGLEHARQIRDLRTMGHVLCDLGLLLTELGREDEAEAELLRAIELAPSTSDPYVAGRAHAELARLLARARRPVDLAGLDAAIDAMRENSLPSELEGIIRARDEVARLIGE